MNQLIAILRALASSRLGLLIVILLTIHFTAYSQDLSLYEKQWFVQSGDTLPYRILLPKDFDPAKKYPLLVFLHGSGERGDDNEKQLIHGARLFLRDSIREKYPAIIVFPQCPVNSYWSNVEQVLAGSRNGKRSYYFLTGGEPSLAMRLAMQLLDNLLLRYPVQAKQVYVMGLSMGGMGTFEIVRRKPGFFAAAVPVCGGADPATARQMTGVKWWIFHGGKDDVVLPAFSQKMVEALEKAKAPVRFTLYPNANHNSWDPAFAEPELLSWLFAQKRK